MNDFKRGNKATVIFDDGVMEYIYTEEGYFEIFYTKNGTNKREEIGESLPYDMELPYIIVSIQGNMPARFFIDSENLH